MQEIVTYKLVPSFQDGDLTAEQSHLDGASQASRSSSDDQDATTGNLLGIVRLDVSVPKNSAFKLRAFDELREASKST